MSEGVTVLLREEYGFRWWLWKPGMIGKELIEWWKNLQSMEDAYYDIENALPGELQQIPGDSLNGVEDKALDEGRKWYAHICWDDDSFLLTPSEKKILHKGYIQPNKRRESA